MTSAADVLELQTRKVLTTSTALLAVIWISAISSISSAQSYQDQLDQGIKPANIATPYSGMSLLVLFAMAATWIVTSRWLGMLHDESTSRTPGSMRLARRWTLWGWIVPFASLWLPKTIVDDLLKERGFDHRVGATRTTIWWLSWIGFYFLFNASAAMNFRADPNTVPIHPNLEIAAACMLTAAFQLWRPLVRVLSTRST